jgi:hypothetical protein
MDESNYGRAGDYGANQEIYKLLEKTEIFTADFSRSLPEPHKSNVRHASALVPKGSF